MNSAEKSNCFPVFIEPKSPEQIKQDAEQAKLLESLPQRCGSAEFVFKEPGGSSHNSDSTPDFEYQKAMHIEFSHPPLKNEETVPLAVPSTNPFNHSNNEQ